MRDKPLTPLLTPEEVVAAHDKLIHGEGIGGDVASALCDMALRYAQPSETKRSFSDFIRNATDAEKEEVYTEVMKRASERQTSETNARIAAPQEGAGSPAGPAVENGEPVAAATISETPRTDALEVYGAMMGGSNPWTGHLLHQGERYWVPSKDARQLESDLAEAKTRAWHLEAEVNGLRLATTAPSATREYPDAGLNLCNCPHRRHCAEAGVCLMTKKRP